MENGLIKTFEADPFPGVEPLIKKREMMVLLWLFKLNMLIVFSLQVPKQQFKSF